MSAERQESHRVLRGVTVKSAENLCDFMWFDVYRVLRTLAGYSHQKRKDYGALPAERVLHDVPGNLGHGCWRRPCCDSTRARLCRGAGLLGEAAGAPVVWISSAPIGL